MHNNIKQYQDPVSVNTNITLLQVEPLAGLYSKIRQVSRLIKLKITISYIVYLHCFLPLLLCHPLFFFGVRSVVVGGFFSGTSGKWGVRWDSATNDSGESSISTSSPKKLSFHGHTGVMNRCNCCKGFFLSNTTVHPGCRGISCFG